MSTQKKIKLFNKLIDDLQESHPFKKISSVQEMKTQMPFIDTDILNLTIEGYTFNLASWNIIHKMYALSLKDKKKMNQFLTQSEQVLKPIDTVATPQPQPQAVPDFSSMMPMFSKLFSQIDLKSLATDLKPDELLKDLTEHPEKYAAITDMAEKLIKDNNIDLNKIFKS